VDDLVYALKEARNAKDAVVREVAVPTGGTLYASVSPVQSVGWVIVMQDITPLKELDKLRTEWVATVSHDLKNPIAAVQLSAGLLEKAGPLNEMQHEILAKLHRGSERMRSLVTDVLDLARLEAGPALRASAVDPLDFIAETIADVETMASNKSLTLITDLPSSLPAVRGDAALLARVMSNLLSNAIKYTSTGGQVTVRAQPQDDVLQIEVTDTGHGIPEKALPHIFDRFYRVPGSEEEAEGTGLGLSIVRSIVEKHGGRIWVESEENKGSTFAFTVPVEKTKDE
jgi:signal transduction histidine kinase